MWKIKVHVTNGSTARVEEIEKNNPFPTKTTKRRNEERSKSKKSKKKGKKRKKRR